MKKSLMSLTLANALLGYSDIDTRYQPVRLKNLRLFLLLRPSLPAAGASQLLRDFLQSEFEDSLSGSVPLPFEGGVADMRSFCLDGAWVLAARAMRQISRNPVEASVALVLAIATVLMVCP